MLNRTQLKQLLQSVFFRHRAAKKYKHRISLEALLFYTYTKQQDTFPGTDLLHQRGILEGENDAFVENRFYIVEANDIFVRNVELLTDD